MAKFEKILKGDFDNIVKYIEDEVLSSNISSSLEDGSDFAIGDARCSVRVFERYSAIGNNRVSLNVTLFQNGDSDIYLSAVTSGGSQAVLFKINTLGEQSFLDGLEEIIDSLEG
jgi:hypothetical protein